MDYQMGDHQNSPSSFNVAPTSDYWQPYSRIEDCELKERITIDITRTKSHKAFGIWCMPRLGHILSICLIWDYFIYIFV